MCCYSIVVAIYVSLMVKIAGGAFVRFTKISDPPQPVAMLSHGVRVLYLFIHPYVWHPIYVAKLSGTRMGQGTDNSTAVRWCCLGSGPGAPNDSSPYRLHPPAGY